MRKGIAELCVLAVLSKREAYGYEILSQIGEHPSLAVKESTLYLLLGRLLKEGFVTFRTEKSTKGPPRRYFRLTPEGQSRLDEMAAFWVDFDRDVSALVTDEGKKHG